MKVELFVEGEPVSLNAFTQEIIGKVAAAMAESLHGVSQSWKEMEIKVTK